MDTELFHRTAAYLSSDPTAWFSRKYLAQKLHYSNCPSLVKALNHLTELGAVIQSEMPRGGKPTKLYKWQAHSEAAKTLFDSLICIDGEYLR